MRQKVRRWCAACCAGLGLAGGTVAAAEVVPQAEPGPRIGLETTVLKVRRDAGGADFELDPVVALAAGDELRYAIRFRNHSATLLEPGRVQIRTAMPAGTRFVPGSAGGVSTRVEYSTDGATYGPDPAANGDATGVAVSSPDTPAADPAAAGADAPADEPPVAAPGVVAAPAPDVDAEAPLAAAEAAVEDSAPAPGTAPAPGGSSAETSTPAASAVEAPSRDATAAAGGLVIRWTFEASLAPGASGEAYFHVVLE